MTAAVALDLSSSEADALLEDQGFQLLCALADLPPLDREVLVDNVILGRSLADIGAEHGTTRQAMSLRRLRAERRVRFELARFPSFPSDPR